MLAGLRNAAARAWGADPAPAAPGVSAAAPPAGLDAADPRLRYCATIDLRGGDFEDRRAEITRQLMDAAGSIGFFQVINHGIPQSEVDAAFALSEAYFSLPPASKAAGEISNRYGTMPFGYECPAAATSNPNADLKESLLGSFRPDVASIWPSEEECPGLKPGAERFMLAASALAARLLGCLEDGLGVTRGALTAPHAPGAAGCLNVTRLMHYPVITERTGRARCSAHTDFCAITCLFQRPGQPGLEVFVPETRSWLPVDPAPGAITINIGEMLAYQSDGRLRSALQPRAHARARRRRRRRQGAAGGRALLDCFLRKRLRGRGRQGRGHRGQPAAVDGGFLQGEARLRGGAPGLLQRLGAAEAARGGGAAVEAAA
ncbi:MAG: hypothetical protein J3K34DRAFT_26981 [Monoraphidium minutum]|nr:MAG: hypothetical protein J3K34DRAFT_26981 [Monoraphidium minutum]